MFIAFDLKSQAKELQPGHVIVLCSWETPLSRTVPLTHVRTLNSVANTKSLNVSIEILSRIILLV